MAEIIKPIMTNLWASGGAVVAPPASKVDLGWTAEIPPHQYQNWYQLRADSAIAYMFQHGIPEWDSTTEYFAGRSFASRNGQLYIALTNNVGSDPATTPVAWSVFPKQGTTTTPGSLALATGAEAIAGTNATKAITPSTMSQAKSYKILFGSLTPGAISFVVPDNVYSITFELVGGGGGGGAGSATASGVGGGAGGFGIKTLAVTPGQTLSGVLGARGNAGGGANGPGGNGGASTFGGVTANGGGGGGGGTTGGGGLGGTVTGADWAFSGGNGNGPSVQNVAGTISFGAPGGIAARQGMPIMGYASTTGIPGTFPGNGGGSGAGGSATIQAGGQGGPGSIIIWG